MFLTEIMNEIDEIVKEAYDPEEAVRKIMKKIALLEREDRALVIEAIVRNYIIAFKRAEFATAKYEALKREKEALKGKEQ